jgi:hypothetical protein
VPAPTLHLRGGPETSAKIIRFAERNLPDSLKRTAEDSAKRLGDTIRRAQPTDSGQLARSVNVTPKRDQIEVTLGGPGLPYAGWIEFGGSRATARTGAGLSRAGLRMARSAGLLSGGRPFVKTGRTIYPAIKALRAEHEKRTAADLEREAAGALR